jgi:tripartite-type tricarboxylate transporter receptor subunit TctC
MNSKRFALAALLAAVLWLSINPAAAVAQDYPNRPIRIVVGFPAGGGVDTVARVIGNDLSKSLGQPIVVENKPGAAGHPRRR